MIRVLSHNKHFSLYHLAKTAKRGTRPIRSDKFQNKMMR
jgi:hypothetical protein